MAPPAILITADRSPHVRAAAREENIAVLNKPVKPASLRALLGQWRTQQMEAAAEMSRLPRPKAVKPSSVNPLWLRRNSPRVQSDLSSTFALKARRSAASV
jgi:hypothetical protein